MAELLSANEKQTCVAYCENCRHDQIVYIACEEETLDIEGVSYTYPVRYGYCSTCGEKATPQDILDDNQLAFSEAVRAHNGIVSLEITTNLVSRYNIKPRPLSSLLDWGEHTYSRFLQGDIPSKTFSNRIRELWESPLSYLLLLLEGGDRLTGVALRKTRAAAQDALVRYGSKAEQVAAYLIGRTESNSSLALQKELYYAQGLCMAFCGRPLIPNHCEAWKLGPVFPEVWLHVHPREVSEEHLANSGLDECVRAHFMQQELEVLDAVVAHVGCYSPYTLRDITHLERPWMHAREGLSDCEASCTVIPDEVIASYFAEVRDSFGLEKPDDFGQYMRHMAWA